MAGLGALGGSGLFAGNSLAVLGAGLLSGAVAGGALLATGTVEFGGNAGTGGTGGGGAALELVPCPDQGPVVGTIPRNQQVLVTARSADGAWLQLYWPAPGIERAWTIAGPLKLEGDVSSLPVAECDAPPSSSPRPTPAAEVTPSPEVTPTPIPTAPPTSGPTAPPTARPNSAPKVSGLTASTKSVSFDQGGYCAGDPKSVTFSVSASDSDGLANVTLFYRPPGSAGFLTRPMTASGGRYVATLNTTADNLKSAGELRYYVAAKDRNAAAKSARLPSSGSLPLTVKVCKNTGPKFTLLTASPGSIITDPLGVGCPGSTLSELRARATDVDGVKSVKLFFKKPGASGYTGRAFTSDSGTWYSYINTVASVDNIVRNGTISWYAVATDKKGATTKSPVRSITVSRCDSPATFDTGGYSPKRLDSLVPEAIQILGHVTDNDGTRSMTLRWRIIPATGGNSTLKAGTVRMTKPAGSAFWVANFTSAKGWPRGLLVWTFRAVDNYGKTYTSQEYGSITVY